jgi:aspartyl-tRNA(Asn)/glutamyl-tRNA(Gln) amidotransferase subunit B
VLKLTSSAIRKTEFSETISDVKIGLEIHVQLTALTTKLFCGCPTDYRGMPPNSVCCPICLGLPGTLPVINKRAIELAMMVSLALSSNISKISSFYRKNYFYIDLPKDFQISQYDKAGGVPIAIGGHVDFEMQHQKKLIRIRRLQLEEDPGRLKHIGMIDKSPYTLVDYNRSGITLLEIVTEPDFSTPEEARIFLRKLRSILEHLGVADVNLRGSLRCDANISVGDGRRVEIKNISSFKEVKRALNYEIIRQKQALRRGEFIAQETRHWDEDRRITFTLRTKEEEHDYRYFREPDLPIIEISDKWIEKIKTTMPELPDARKERFQRDYQIPVYDAEVLTSEKYLADFFETCITYDVDAKKVSNWLMSDFLRFVNELDLEFSEILLTPEDLATMIRLIDQEVISGKIGKTVLREMLATGKTPQTIIEELGLKKIDNTSIISDKVKEVFEEYPDAVRDAMTNKNAIRYLVGQVMAKTRGRADPVLTNEIIELKLEELQSKNTQLDEN